MLIDVVVIPIIPPTYLSPLFWAERGGMHSIRARTGKRSFFILVDLKVSGFVVFAVLS